MESFLNEFQSAMKQIADVFKEYFKRRHNQHIDKRFEIKEKEWNAIKKIASNVNKGFKTTIKMGDY